jgi:hypothetical protein
VGLVRKDALAWLGTCALACGFDTSGLATSGAIAESGDGTQSTTGAGDDSVDAVDDADADPDAGDAPEAGADGPGDDTTAAETGGSPCGDWWNTQWTRRRAIALKPHTLEQPIADVPVMLLLEPNRIDYAATQVGGGDLRLVSEGAVLAHEIETWKGGNDSYVWVRLPQIVAQGDAQPIVHMYYGNPSAADESMPTQVWDAGFVSVHHLQGMQDSTANAHDGGSLTPPMATPGWIGGAHAFDGYDDHLVLPNEAAYDFADAMTVEAWIRVEVFDTYYQAIVTKGDDAWRLHREATTPYACFGSDTRYSADDNLPGAIPVDDGEWHYVVAVYGGDEKRLFVDGTLDGAMPYPGPLRQTDHAVLIGENQQMQYRHFWGDIDEVRISSVARERSWIGIQMRSMNDDLVEFGPEETCG